MHKVFYKFRNIKKKGYPYIIAEVGVNHEGDMDLAKRMVSEAKEGGAHAVKFQAYKAATIASSSFKNPLIVSAEPASRT